MKKGCLITGGAGFIGSHLADLLIGQGHPVIVVDDLSLGRRSNIVHLQDNQKFSFYEQDILDDAALAKVFNSHDITTVYHLAANSDIAQSFKTPDIDFKNTLQTTFNVLKQMKINHVDEIVFASSSAIYGEFSFPIHENQGPLQPQSHYGAAKLASEAFIYSFVENYGIKAWIARFPNVVGGRATHGVIFDFIKRLKLNPTELQILGDGNQNKPYLFVKDLVEAIYFLHERACQRINVFNVGVDSTTTVKNIADFTCREMNLTPAYIFTGGARGWSGDIPHFQYELGKIWNLGWKASHTSDEAVKAAITAILGDFA
jgi:UDP-glucose 4-epimerase